MNRSELMRRFGVTLWCLTLVCGCGAKKENQPQGAQAMHAAAETQVAKNAAAPKNTQTAEQQDSATAEDWPRQVTKDGNRLTFYQPQIDSWTDYRQLDGRVAVVLTPAGGESVTGMITLQAQTDTDIWRIGPSSSMTSG